MRFGVGGEFSNVLTELGTDLITGAEGALVIRITYIVQLCHQQNRNCIVCGENHYKAIGVTNLVLDALPEASISEAEKESYGAEMNFFQCILLFRFSSAIW